ncbi:MAG: SPOR domain-containing protein [Desulfobacterales bacterium]|jgi:cell division septation protein DedD|nr:SPOR domain-containing protein [Desulfobacterales bacterium]
MPIRKKNKRKEPEFKKPFIVMTRRKIAGWVFVIFFLCAWMFVLGILVGRGTAPVKFDIAAIEKKIEASKKDDPGKPGKVPAHKDSATLKDKTKLEFYEALKENSEDTKVPALQKPKIIKQKIEKPAETAVSPKPQEATPQEPTSAKAVSQKAGLQKSKPVTTPQKDTPIKEKVAAVKQTATTGPLYTIQAASVKNAKDADRLIEKLKKSGYPAYRAIGKVEGKGIWFRVRIGEYKSKSEALGVMKKLKKDGLKPIVVMK